MAPTVCKLTQAGKAKTKVSIYLFKTPFHWVFTYDPLSNQTFHFVPDEETSGGEEAQRPH